MIQALEEQKAQQDEDEEQEERDRIAAEEEEGLLYSMAKKFRGKEKVARFANDGLEEKERPSKRRRDEDGQDNTNEKPQKISRGFIKPEQALFLLWGTASLQLSAFYLSKQIPSRSYCEAMYSNLVLFSICCHMFCFDSDPIKEDSYNLSLQHPIVVVSPQTFITFWDDV